MYFTDEKDYIMRMIKEMVRVLFSLMFGKKYVSVELEKENKYEVSGKNLKDFLDMIDSGEINEAENILLDSIDYTDRNEVMAAALFYQYLSEKDSEFLKNNNYTKEEVTHTTALLSVFPEARATVESEIESMLNGKEDVDTAVKNMADSINKSIEEYNLVNE